MINTQKSSCSPSKEILFLGFILNLENMSISLPIEKVKMIINLGKDTLEQKLVKIRLLARLLGCLLHLYQQ